MPSQSEITTRLNADNSAFRSVMNQSVRVAQEAGQKLTKNLDLKDATRTMAAAIGINIQDIAQSFARLWTGMSKQAEENYNKIVELSDAIAAKNIANNLARLNDDQRYLLLVRERESLQKSIAENEQKNLGDERKMKEDLLRLANLTGDIEKQQRAYAIEDNKKIDEAITAAHERHMKELDEAGARRKQVYDQQQEADQRHSAYVDSHVELLTLEAKVGHGITEEELRRLEVLRLQQKAMEIQAQIKSLLSLEKRTPQEEATLQTLFRQNDAINDQIKLKTDVVDKTVEQAEAEAGVVKALEFATNKLKSYVDEWTGFMVKITTFGRGDKELSDRELERKIGNLRADISQRESNLFGQAGVAGSLPYDSFLNPQKSNLAQALAEQRFREQVRSTASNLGEDAAFQQFTGLTESRFREIIGTMTEQTKQTDLLQQIVDQQKKGIVTVPMGT